MICGIVKSMLRIRRIKRLFSNLLTLFFTFLVLFIVFEVFLQITKYEDPFENSVYRANPGEGFRLSDNPNLVYELVPNASFVEEGRGKLCVTNSFGFRDEEFGVEKNSDEFRIAVIGDSLVFGVNVDQNESFPEQLEVVLNSLNLPRKVKVLNFGVPGYDTIQEVETFKTKAMKFKPDLVILAYTLNDVEGVVKARPLADEERCGIAYLNIKIDCDTKEFLRKSKALKFVKYRVNAFIWYVKLGDYISNLYTDEAKYRDNVFVQLSEFSNLTHSGLNSTPVLVVFPVLSAVSRDSYKYQYIHDNVTEDANGLGFLTIDLSAAYKGYSQREIQAVKGDYFHPSVFGHRLAADFVTEKLINNKLIPLN